MMNLKKSLLYVLKAGMHTLYPKSVIVVMVCLGWHMNENEAFKKLKLYFMLVP